MDKTDNKHVNDAIRAATGRVVPTPSAESTQPPVARGFAGAGRGQGGMSRPPSMNDLIRLTAGTRQLSEEAVRDRNSLFYGTTVWTIPTIK